MKIQIEFDERLRKEILEFLANKQVKIIESKVDDFLVGLHFQDYPPKG